MIYGQMLKNLKEGVKMFNLIDYEWFGRVIVSVIEIAFLLGIGVLIMKRIIRAWEWVKKYFQNYDFWWK